MQTPQKINEKWIPIIVKIRDLIEEEDLFDREKIAILLILAGNYLTNLSITKKDAQQLLGWAMSTYYSNIPVSRIGLDSEQPNFTEKK